MAGKVKGEMGTAFWIIAPLLGVLMMALTGWAAFAMADRFIERRPQRSQTVSLQEIMEGSNGRG